MLLMHCFFLMIRRPPRSTQSRSSAASDVYKRQIYEPTILTGTNAGMKVCSHEVFGPIVIVEPYSHFEEAINAVNDSPFGLQAGIFTNQLDEEWFAFNNLDVGGVIINDVPTFRVDHMPYGGIKESGFGREGVKYAIHDMMEPKLLVRAMR